MRKEYDFSKSVKNPYVKKVKKKIVDDFLTPPMELVFKEELNELSIKPPSKIRPTYADFKKEALENPEFKKAYDALEDEYKIKRELIRMRKNQDSHKKS